MTEDERAIQAAFFEDQDRSIRTDFVILYKAKTMLKEGLSWENVSFLLQNQGYSYLDIQGVYNYFQMPINSLTKKNKKKLMSDAINKVLGKILF